MIFKKFNEVDGYLTDGDENKFRSSLFTYVQATRITARCRYADLHNGDFLASYPKLLQSRLNSSNIPT